LLCRFPFIRLTNFRPRIRTKYLPTSLDELIQQDLDEYEEKKKSEDSAVTNVEEVGEGGSIITTTTTTVTVEKTVINGKTTSKNPMITIDESAPIVDAPTEVTTTTTKSTSGTATPAAPNVSSDDPNVPDTVVDQLRNPKNKAANSDDKDDDDKEEMKGKVLVDHDDPNSVYVGLRVHTHKNVPAVIVGRLKAPVVTSTTPAAAATPPTNTSST